MATRILYIIAREGLRQGQLRGGAVGTLMSNMGLELALKQLGIPFARAKVGDRYVLEMLQEKGWRIGAENSGHVILLDEPPPAMALSPACRWSRRWSATT